MLLMFYAAALAVVVGFLLLAIVAPVFVNATAA